MSNRSTSTSSTQPQIAVVVPPAGAITYNPAYESLLASGNTAAAAAVLQLQTEYGVTQVDIDLERAFYAAEIGVEVCEGTQVACFRRDRGYTPRSAEEMDAYSNSREELDAYLLNHPAPDAVQIVEQPAAQVVAGSAAVVEAVDQDESAVRDELVDTLKTLVKAYSKGEKAYRQGLLEAGRLCRIYISGRLTLGDARKAAVQTVEGQIAMYSSSTVDAGRLMMCYEAYRLLADECGLAKAAENVAYGHYRDAWSRLVERVSSKTSESYVLLPGMEGECKAAFKAAVDNGLAKEAAVDKVAGLVREYAAKQEAVRQQEAAKAKQAAKDAEQAKYQAAERTRLAAVMAKEQEAALAQVAEGDEDAKSQLTINMEDAQAALLQAQAVERKRIEEAAEADRKRAQADKADAEAKAAKERADRKAAEKAAAKENKTAVVVEKPSGSAGGNLLRMAKAGAAKDVAAMAAELVTGGDAPDDVFAALLALLADSGELCAASRKACNMALSALKVAERRVVTVALPAAGNTVESNGHAAPVA